MFGVILWICSWTYSEGSHSGTVVQISQNGVLFKSTEGKLNLGADKHSISTTNIWPFSVLDDSIANILKAHEGKYITAYYKQRYKTMPWLGETNYIVTKLDTVTK